MRDAPPPEVILEIVAETLRDTADATSPGAVYARRIAASLADTIARELRAGPADDAAERRRLEALLGSDGDLAALNAKLGAALLDGALTLDSPAVAAHLWSTARAKIAIDQPRYDIATLRP